MACCLLASPGYEGANCETDINECAEQPCENGECFERSDPSYWESAWEVTFADLAGYLCQCHPGFAGQWPAASSAGGGLQRELWALIHRRELLRQHRRV